MKLRGKEGRDNQLGNALSGLNRLCRLRMIVECHHDLPAVIGVHNTYLIGRSETALGGKAASGIDETRVSHRDLGGKTRAEDDFADDDEDFLD